MFGLAPSPYQSQYVMKLHASKYFDSQDATEAILQGQYVDDILSGAQSEEAAIETAKDIKQILAEGGFNLRNWHSNSKKLEAELNGTSSGTQDFKFPQPDAQDLEKVLGIFWEKNSDCITYSLRFIKGNKAVLSGEKRPTKRETLRVLMSIFDHPGLLSHFTTGLKIMQQSLWRANIGWDDPIPDDQYDQWTAWLRDLPRVEDLKIPRAYLTEDVPLQECNLQLHTFVDAGESAYACASYLRMELPDAEIRTVLVAAKSKTAPIKYTSIPRLELQAAVMGARLASFIKKHLKIPALDDSSKCYYWTDSRTVKSWLGQSKRQPIFIAARVGEILESSTQKQWNWTPSKDNTADLATKWHNDVDLSEKSSWYFGPSFLKEEPQKWPKQQPTPEEHLEAESLLAHFDEPEPESNCLIETSRFSRFWKMQRVMAYVHRFCHNARAKAQKRAKIPTEHLQSHELLQGELNLYKVAQRTHYGSVIEKLERRQPLPRKCPLLELSPFLDDQGLLRMRGRIEAAPETPYVIKFPIILPRASRITKLMVYAAHRICLHLFTETVVNKIRQRFYVTSLRSLVKFVRTECTFCKMKDAKPAVPEMSPLPVARLAIGCPTFTHTGVDLFGPLTVIVRRRPEKRYGVVFTCMTVRAVHIEVADDLSTNAFIMCYKNFMHRRGRPRHLYCDNGTNLVGAANLFKKLDSREIEKSLTTSATTWHFNPPHAQHMGGCWERMVRTVKSALDVFENSTRKPSPSILRCALTEIEYIVNSRPLTHVAVAGPEEEALTPNHILLGHQESIQPIGEPSDTEEAVRQSWALAQNLAHRFRIRWVRAYLPSLTRRTKWHVDSPPLKEGDLVIIVDEFSKRRDWTRGRVLQVKKSQDGKIRSAMIQTTSGVCHRPASKLARLDLKPDGSAEAATSCTPRSVADPQRDRM